MGPDDSESFEQTGRTVADETPDPAELIRMKHKDARGEEVATATREAFDVLWEPKGWLLVQDDGTPIVVAAPDVLIDQPDAVLKGNTLSGQIVTTPAGKQDVGTTPSDTGATK